MNLKDLVSTKFLNWTSRRHKMKIPNLQCEIFCRGFLDALYQMPPLREFYKKISRGSVSPCERSAFWGVYDPRSLESSFRRTPVSRRPRILTGSFLYNDKNVSDLDETFCGCRYKAGQLSLIPNELHASKGRIRDHYINRPREAHSLSLSSRSIQ